MTNLYGMFETNPDKEKGGVWVYPVGEGADAPAFKVARAGGANRKFMDIQTAKLRPYQRLITAQSKSMSPELQETVMKAVREAFAKTCMVDWKNVTDKKGVAIPFNEENAEKLLTELPALYEELLSAAQNLSSYQDEQIEEEAGN